jgi:hypothetical protein
MTTPEWEKVEAGRKIRDVSVSHQSVGASIALAREAFDRGEYARALDHLKQSDLARLALRQDLADAMHHLERVRAVPAP